MQTINLINNFNEEIVARLFVSLLLGFVIGLERELTNKFAGLRTHILVCLGSTIYTILSIYGFTSIYSYFGMKATNDPARVAAQILTGIGFIGGGTVLHHGTSVSGLTTAASLWLTASIGMAVGTGNYSVAVMAAIFGVSTLVVIRRVERSFLYRHRKKCARIKVTALCHDVDCLTRTQDWFYNEFDSIIEMKLVKSCPDHRTNLIFIMDIYDNNPINTVYKKLKDLQDIESLTLQQANDSTQIIEH